MSDPTMGITMTMGIITTMGSIGVGLVIITATTSTMTEITMVGEGETIIAIITAVDGTGITMAAEGAATVMAEDIINFQEQDGYLCVE